MDDLEKYLAITEFVPDLKVDIGYIIYPDFYYDPDNGWTENDRKHKRIPLEKPAFELYDNYALSEVVEGNETQLIKYYMSVIKASKTYHKPIKAGGHHFWLRPLIFKKGLSSISFPWYDTYVEATRFLDSLAKNNDGWIFDDMDQGWQVAVYARGDRFHFIQRDWEQDEAEVLISGSRGQLSVMAKQCIERNRKLIELLTENTGTDFWTERRR